MFGICSNERNDSFGIGFIPLGVPIRVEIGPKDCEKSQLTVVIRHNGVKSTIPVADCVDRLRNILEEIHNELYKKYVNTDPSIN